MIGLNPAVEITSLKKEEQKQLLDARLCTIYTFVVSGSADEKQRKFLLSGHLVKNLLQALRIARIYELSLDFSSIC